MLRKLIVITLLVSSVASLIGCAESSNSNYEEKLRTQFESELRPVIESELRPVLESELRPAIESDLRSVLESELHSAIESKLRPVMESELRPVIESEIREAIRAEASTQAPPDDLDLLKYVEVPYADIIADPDKYMDKLLKVSGMVIRYKIDSSQMYSFSVFEYYHTQSDGNYIDRGWIIERTQSEECIFDDHDIVIVYGSLTGIDQMPRMEGEYLAPVLSVDFAEKVGKHIINK